MSKALKAKDAENRNKRQLALLGKLVADNNNPGTYDAEGNRTISRAPVTMASAISNATAQILDDVDSIRQLLPDIEIVDQILISSILSPKDLSLPKLTFSSSVDFESPELSGKLIDVIRRYAEEDFGIAKELPIMLRDMLFKTGSYIHMIVPESSLDKLINQDSTITLESAAPHFSDPKSFKVRPIGILGGFEKETKENDTFTLESFFEGIAPTIRPTKDGFTNTNLTLCSTITLMDNPEAVKIPSLIKRLRSQRVNNALKTQYAGVSGAFSLESADGKEKPKKIKLSKLGKTDQEIERNLSNNRQFTPEQMIEITDIEDERASRGHPLIMKLSPEAVVPIHSSPEEHIAYLIIIDQYGNPINTRQATDHYRDLQNNYKADNNLGQSVSGILNELRGNTGGMTGTGIDSFQEATRTFSELFERKLLKSVRKGLGEDGLNIAMTNNMYQVMFSRALKNKHTQILYVPAELMSYMAFYYNNHGVGKSLMESGRVLASMRVLLLVANLMTAVRNSTTETELDIQLDPTDSDPQGSVAMIVETALRMRADNLPLGQGNIGSMIDFLNRAGITAVVSGHPDLPEMKVQKNDKSRSMVRPDTELMEELRKLHLQNFGLSPEQADASKDVNLATSIVQSSLMLSKRVLLLQSEFEPQVADFFKKITRYSETLRTELKDIIQSDGKTKDKRDADQLINKFIDSIKVSLPKPDTVTLEAQLAAFENQVRAWEAGLDAYFSQEWAATVSDPDLVDQIDDIKAALLAHLKRDWLRRNNVMPELDAITEKDLDGKPMFKFGEIHSQHVGALEDMLKDYLDHVEKQTKKRQELEAKREAEGQDEYQSGEPEDDGDEALSTDDAATEEGGDDIPADDAAVDEDETGTPDEGEPEEEEGVGTPAEDEFDAGDNPDELPPQ